MCADHGRHGGQVLRDGRWRLELGAWIVGAQITPGTYRAANSTQGSYWKRLSNFTGGLDAIIASAIASSSGAQLVTIANTDAGFSATTECGTWTREP